MINDFRPSGADTIPAGPRYVSMAKTFLNMNAEPEQESSYWARSAIHQIGYGRVR